MYLQTLLLLSTTATATILDVLSLRQSNNETDYLQEVCFPPSTDPVPPCQSIINIQTACEPNGTSPLYLEAHAQCMCKGSFFADWIGCLDCNYVHGGRSPAVVSAFHTIITSASNILCTGTPTASFAAIFNGLSDDSGINEGGAGNGTATRTTDLYPGSTQISLYYTASGSQGPGAITGSATAATATGSRAVPSDQQTRTSGTTTSAGSQETGNSEQSSTTSSSSAGAAPTGVWMGAFGAVAGGMVMAAL